LANEGKYTKSREADVWSFSTLILILRYMANINITNNNDNNNNKDRRTKMIF
jgi:hypothetical protein